MPTSIVLSLFEGHWERGEPLLRRLLPVGGDQWGVIRLAFREDERLKTGGRGGAEDTASRVE